MSMVDTDVDGSICAAQAVLRPVAAAIMMLAAARTPAGDTTSDTAKASAAVCGRDGRQEHSVG